MTAISLNVYFRWNSLLIPPLGFLLNFTLLWLILRRTPKEMWLHSRVLLQTCILDILLLIVFIFGIPYASFIEDKFFVLFDGYLLASKWFNLNNDNPNVQRVFFICWHSLYNFDVFGIAVQFLYRYLSLNRSIKINFRLYLLFLAIPLFFTLLTAWIPEYLAQSNPQSNAKILAEASSLWIDFNQNPIYVIKIETSKLDLLAKITNISWTLYYLICYSIIIFCGHQMVRFVASHAMSDGLKAMNKQLTTNLIIYASYPIIFHATMLILFISNFIDSLENVGIILTSVIHWLPILNPLASLWTFRPYRDALIGPFKKARILPQ